MIRKDIIDLFRVPAGATIRLKDYNPGWTQTEEMEELVDTPTPEGCGILSSATTARRTWSDTVSLSVRWLAPPRPRVPHGTHLASQSLDCRNSTLGGVLADISDVQGVGGKHGQGRPGLQVNQATPR